MRGAKALLLAGGSSVGSVPTGLSTSVQRCRALSCGWAHTAAMSLTWALAICAPSRRLMTCSMPSSANAWTMIARKATRLSERLKFAEKRSSLRNCGCSRTLSQNIAHSRSFCSPSITVPSSPTGNGPYG
ncbi:hypothetical protein D3C86_1769230 [compost metagenome]